MEITRRNFLKLSGAGAVSITSGRVLNMVSGNFPWKVEKIGKYYDDPAPVKGVHFAMAIDTQACIGCRRCVYACIKENNIGRTSGIQYIRILEMEESSFDLLNSDPYFVDAPKEDKWYLPAHCNQCDNPPCVQACPVTATWKEPDGIVVVDYDRCIGCRNCMINCPYWARKFNWIKPEVPEDEINPEVPIRPIGVVEKCTFCIHLVRRGITTKCTEVCPVGARKFGNTADPDSEISYLLRTRRVTVLKEDLGTEPQVFYVG